MKSKNAKANKTPTRTGRGGNFLAEKRFIEDTFESEVCDKVDSGMTEEEARESTKKIHKDNIAREDRFLKARENRSGEYVEEETKELAKNIVSC